MPKQLPKAGPLDENSRRLVKLALSIGAGLDGATHSAVRNAHKADITPEEIDHVAVLAITTLGLPAATRAMTWYRTIPDRRSSFTKTKQI